MSPYYASFERKVIFIKQLFLLQAKMLKKTSPELKFSAKFLILGHFTFV